MPINNSTFLTICSAIIFSTSAIAKDISIYRWVDENNIVHFSQHEPRSDNHSQLITFSSYQAKQNSSVKPLPSVDEQLAKDEKRQAEILAKNKVIAEKNCQAAKVNIKMLNSFNKISVSDSDGKSRVLTEKEKHEQINLSNKHIDLYCNGTES